MYKRLITSREQVMGVPGWRKRKCANESGRETEWWVVMSSPNRSRVHACSYHVGTAASPSVETPYTLRQPLVHSQQQGHLPHRGTPGSYSSPSPSTDPHTPDGTHAYTPSACTHPPAHNHPGTPGTAPHTTQAPSPRPHTFPALSPRTPRARSSRSARCSRSARARRPAARRARAASRTSLPRLRPRARAPAGSTLYARVSHPRHSFDGSTHRR
jgi:hypothetical protein